MSTTNFHYLVKYIIVGDSSVGKSNILLQFTQRKFKTDHEITIGVEFGARNIPSKENKIFRVQVWDTVKKNLIKAGQETFRSITRAYYKNSVCAFLVYDITKRETFDHISAWYEECRAQSPKTILIVLVGNKVDLESQRQVSFEEGEDFAKKNDMLFFETSAKTNVNIDEVFSASIERISNNIQNNFYDLSNENCGIKMGIGNNYYDKQFSLKENVKIAKNGKNCC